MITLDITDSVETITGQYKPYGALVLDAADVGEIIVNANDTEMKEEFTLESFVVGPGLIAYSVAIYADLNPEGTVAVWGLVFQETKNVIDPLMSRFIGTFGPTYKKQIKVEITNDAATQKTLYFRLSAYSGQSMPGRK